MWFRYNAKKRRFSSLNEKEILALAISSEEDDQRIYLSYAELLKPLYPETAKMFEAMAEDEREHYEQLVELYHSRFGNTIPLIRRSNVKGFYELEADWLNPIVDPDRIRLQATRLEEQAARFYRAAAQRTEDLATRELLSRLAFDEQQHKTSAKTYEETFVSSDIKDQEEEVKRKHTILTLIQPGLAGLIDGSISTLAPIFAAAFATYNTHQTFLIGLSASIGAGISMGLTEAVHDDGKLSGRGSPLKRGLANGLMTTIGGLGHTLPYLIPNFTIATFIACTIVLLELFAIAYIQNKFMEISFKTAMIQIVLGGLIVFAVGIFIGSA